MSPKERYDFITEKLGLKENTYRYNKNYQNLGIKRMGTPRLVDQMKQVRRSEM